LKSAVKKMALSALFASLTAVSAYISIPISYIPVTMQTFIVLLSGILLGSGAGALSQIIYILLGLIGMPVFSGFNGGIQSVLKPSFGFLIGFILASFVTGKMLYADNKNNFSYRNIFLASLTGSMVIYMTGLPYMYFILNVIMNIETTALTVIKTGCLIFLPGDLIKILAASFLASKLLPNIKKIKL